jgi:uncharacterized membrane protein YeaQ/YmgE (transglycosylase-associated protein family)
MVVFILLGLIAGYVAIWLFKRTGMNVVLDLGLAVIGAVIAGLLFAHIAEASAAGPDIASALVAGVAGAGVLLAIPHALRSVPYRLRDPI